MGTLLPLFITSFSNGNEMVVALAIVTNIAGETVMLFFAKKCDRQIGLCQVFVSGLRGILYPVSKRFLSHISGRIPKPSLTSRPYM